MPSLLKYMSNIMILGSVGCERVWAAGKKRLTLTNKMLWSCLQKNNLDLVGLPANGRLFEVWLDCFQKIDRLRLPFSRIRKENGIKNYVRYLQKNNHSNNGMNESKIMLLQSGLTATEDSDL